MYNHRLLSGNDNVDKWTQQNLWDAVLNGIHVVVSTPQVLYDALSHGFVTMGRIALLIFDEGTLPLSCGERRTDDKIAHHCMGKSAMNQIMTRFYHPLRERQMDGNIPHVLGLTASPVMRADVRALK